MNRYSRRAYLATTGTAVTALAGCKSFIVNPDITMEEFSFNPGVFTISVGDVVVWYNNSRLDHTVTAYADGIPDGGEYFASGGFESESAARNMTDSIRGTLHPKDDYRHSFETPGSYPYFCIPHEENGMVGRIDVVEDRA